MKSVMTESVVSVNLRRNIFVFTSFLLIASCVYISRKHDVVNSLAGIKIGSGPDVSSDLFQPDHIYIVPKLFNPVFDADGPRPKVVLKSATMGENDVQNALARLALKSSSTNVQHIESRAHSSTLQLFNPSTDPDAPQPKVTAEQQLELAERRRDNQMKAKLKIEAQLAMLTERQNILKKSHSTPRHKPVANVKAPSTFRKPNYASLEDEVRMSLDKGDDPDKIISKELNSELQVFDTIHSVFWSLALHF